jgi:DNA recombination protein RmuC
MSIQSLLFLIVGLVVGGAIGAFVSSIVAHSKTIQVESELKRECDGARQSVAERDSTIGTLKNDLTISTQTVEAKAERVTALEAEKGRLIGELTTVEALRDQVKAKDIKLDELNLRVVEIESVKAERDAGLQSVLERDAAINELKEEIAILDKSVETRQQRIATLESEKGKLAGEISTVESLRSQVTFKDKKLDELNERVVELESAKADLEQLAKSTEKAKIEALLEKDLHLKNTIDAQAEAYRNRIEEKRVGIEGILREKDLAIEQQKKLLADTERILSEKFSALSLESLKSASVDFLRLANERFDKAGEISKAELEKRQQAIDELMKPVAETLDKIGKQHQEIEERRVSAFDSIEKGIKTLSSEADQLANALRKPTSRGAWGEMNLIVILENAGLIQGEHFVLQDTTSDDEEGLARADVLVNLPAGRHLIIDSKAPLEAFWDGMNASDETLKSQKFANHAALVRDHVKRLSSKSYWSRYESSPDFTIMFLTTEGAFQAAIEADRNLIGEAQKSRIYITSPMTLMSMVHAIAFVLREERLAQNTQQVKDTAAELYKRLAKFLEHVEKLGRNLRLTVDNYNSAVGSLDGRVLPYARKMNSLGIGGGADIDDAIPIEAVPRTLVSQDHLLSFSDGQPALLEDQTLGQPTKEGTRNTLN